MNRFLFLLVGIAVFVACVGPPRIYSLNNKPKAVEKACLAPFPTDAWQLVHSLEASFPGRKKSVLMGVTDIFPAIGKIHSVLMTVEGLVLFEAEQFEAEERKSLVIHRSVAPFDSPTFAKGLMDDIRMIFFKPKGELVAFGRMKNGANICRYEVGGDRMMDTIINPIGSWELRQYDLSNRLTRHRLTRLVQTLPPTQPAGAFPAVLELTARGKGDYRLKMILVNATLAH